jgi:hypothetical protein
MSSTSTGASTDKGALQGVAADAAMPVAPIPATEVVEEHDEFEEFKEECECGGLRLTRGAPTLRAPMQRMVPQLSRSSA